MKKKQNIEESFHNSIKAPLSDLSINVSDLFLDNAFDSDLISQIPIAKYLHTGLKISNSLRNRHLFNKIYRFIKEINDIPENDRVNFINDLETKWKDKNVYDNLLLLIDRMDETEKMPIVGKLFKAMMLQKITIEDGFRLIYSVEKSYLNDLLYFNYHYGIYNTKKPRNKTVGEIANIHKYSDVMDYNLSLLGLLKPIYSTYENPRYDDPNLPVEITKYEMSDMGWQLWHYGFDNEMK